MWDLVFEVFVERGPLLALFLPTHISAHSSRAAAGQDDKLLLAQPHICSHKTLDQLQRRSKFCALLGGPVGLVRYGVASSLIDT
jgi:hypothetical protein